MPTVTRFAIREANGGYISLYDYKANRESLDRARLWKSLANVDRYLQTDSYRRLAKHSRGNGLEICEIEKPDTGVWRDCFDRKVVRVVRTIPDANVRAAAMTASTRRERLARGLQR